jgi:His-Xaa-Ser system protein HxsD
MEEEIEIKINSEIYGKDVILRTVEILSNRFYFKQDQNGQYFIIKASKKHSADIFNDDFANLFFDHLNNQVIRQKIYEETKDVRNFIVGKALFETEAYDEQSGYFDINKYQNKDNYILDLENIATI